MIIKRVLILISIALVLPIANGCGRPSGADSQAGGLTYSDYVAGKTAAEEQGWTELGNVFDEMHDVEARLDPKEPKLNEPAKVELRIYCKSKFPDHKIWIRVGNNEPGPIENPDEGAEWVAMKVTSERLWSHKQNKLVDKSQTIPTPNKKQSGETTYESELVFAAGKSFVEFKMDNRFNDQLVSISTLEVNIDAPPADGDGKEKK